MREREREEKREREREKTVDISLTRQVRAVQCATPPLLLSDQRSKLTEIGRAPPSDPFQRSQLGREVEGGGGGGGGGGGWGWRGVDIKI